MTGGNLRILAPALLCVQQIPSEFIRNSSTFMARGLGYNRATKNCYIDIKHENETCAIHSNLTSEVSPMYRANNYVNKRDFN
jgi:hypothetical protein